MVTAKLIPLYLHYSNTSKPRCPEKCFEDNQHFYRYITSDVKDFDYVSGASIKFPDVSVNWSGIIQGQDYWIYAEGRSVTKFNCYACHQAMRNTVISVNNPQFSGLNVRLMHDPTVEDAAEGTSENYSHCLIRLFDGDKVYVQGKGGLSKSIKKVFREEMAMLSLVKKDPSSDWVPSYPNPLISAPQGSSK